MGVYSRFKKDSDGLRKLVTLLETTPSVRRQKMIDVGMVEDPEYTHRALEFIMTFEDILKMPDGELMEVLAEAPHAKIVAYAISKAPKEVQDRFLKCAPIQQRGDIRDFLDQEFGLREVGSGQLKLVSVARDLEKRGIIATKRIPVK